MEYLGKLGKFWEALKPEAHSLWGFGWEWTTFAWIDRHRHPLLDAVLIPASWATEWGLLWIGVLLLLFLTGDARQKQLAVQTGVALFLVSICVIVPLMYLAPRERPYQALPGVAPLSLPLTTPSFPFGHAKSAALMAVVLGAYRPRWAPWLTLFGFLVSYARIYCGMHWPLDVLTGAALGAGAGLLLLRFRRLHRAPHAHQERGARGSRAATAAGDGRPPHQSTGYPGGATRPSGPLRQFTSPRRPALGVATTAGSTHGQAGVD